MNPGHVDLKLPSTSCTLSVLSPRRVLVILTVFPVVLSVLRVVTGSSLLGAHSMAMDGRRNTVPSMLLLHGRAQLLPNRGFLQTGQVSVWMRMGLWNAQMSRWSPAYRNISVP